jgi:hypothetical protein
MTRRGCYAHAQGEASLCRNSPPRNFCADARLGRERLSLVWDGDDAEEAASIDASAVSAKDADLGTHSRRLGLVAEERTFSSGTPQVERDSKDAWLFLC